MSDILELEPKQVFYWFEQISRIPRGSGNIKEISNFLVSFAKERNLEYRQDEAMNVILIKEASEGYENEEAFIIQGHMDMVAVKTAETVKDMTKEGLDLEIKDGYLYAKGTSLGGDDGIAVAYMLALLDSKDIPHPRLEAVITVDEEVGMDGARVIDLSMLKGKRLLNIDSEEEGALLAGCAGGVRVCCSVGGQKTETKGSLYELCIYGLQGGHSGVEIHKKRANANVLLGEIITGISEKVSVSLYKAEGGFADNAISVWANARLVVSAEECGRLEEVCSQITEQIQNSWQEAEPELQIVLKKLEEGSFLGIIPEDTQKMGRLIVSLPNGVQAMSRDIPELVETSLNLGMLKWEDDRLYCDYSVRSSIDSEKQKLIDRLLAITEQTGGSCEVSGSYPGWAFRADSPLRKKMVSIYEKMYGKPPKVEAIHAGLECGLFMEKIQNLDCVSFGPDILDIHTVNEKLDIASAKRVWEYLLEILAEKETSF